MITPTTVAYKDITTMLDGMEAYCRNCGDFYIYQCPDDECDGAICVCCMSWCDGCGREVVFT